MSKIVITDLAPTSGVTEDDVRRITGGYSIGPGADRPTESPSLNFRVQPKRLMGDWNGDGLAEGIDLEQLT
jgi:hypothetical protein